MISFYRHPDFEEGGKNFSTEQRRRRRKNE
jgi:hypothetical protein